MATRRTPEEIEAIVDHCVELEQSGGDILAYLWSENYMTPRATWCNFQREWLGRKPYEYTDGKPKKERKIMSTTRVKLTDEDRMKTCLIAIRGGDPRKHLESLGSSDPQGTWSKVKAWCADKHPEVFAKIPKRITVTDEAPTVKVSGPIRIETPETNKVQVVEKPEKTFEAVKKEIMDIPQVTVADAMRNCQDAADTFFGECEKMGLKTDTQKITKPVVFDGFTIRAVSGVYGRYSYSETRSAYIDYENNDGDELSMTLEQWRGFLDELKHAARVMGVEL